MKIAILGMGTIGSGVYEYAKARNDMTVVRTLDLKAWMDDMTTDIAEIVNDPSIEIVVETMGGLHPAYEYAMKCLNAGKSYVTANKYLVSVYGLELQEAAKANGVSFRFSAACGGGIPYLKNLWDAGMSDNVIRVGGIMNGTTNYILDKMQTEGVSYEDALSEAQALGYAERDPSSDVDGLDTQRKIALASAVAFGALLKSDSIPTFGIRGIKKEDIAYFQKKNLSIRLIAEAKKEGNAVCACVQPTLVSSASPENGIRKNINYLWYEGEKSGVFAFSGQGAGKYPTAANIIRDLLAIGAGEKSMLAENVRLENAVQNTERSFYVRAPLSEKDSLSALIRSMETDGKWLYAVTVPMNEAEIHTMVRKMDGAFLAALA